MADGEFPTKVATRVEVDPEFTLAASQQGFHLRIPFEAFRHVAGLVVTLAGLAEFAPAFHEAVGAALRIGAQLGFELEGADGAVVRPVAASSASSGFFL